MGIEVRGDENPIAKFQNSKLPRSLGIINLEILRELVATVPALRVCSSNNKKPSKTMIFRDLPDLAQRRPSKGVCTQSLVFERIFMFFFKIFLRVEIKLFF